MTTFGCKQFIYPFIQYAYNKSFNSIFEQNVAEDQVADASRRGAIAIRWKGGGASGFRLQEQWPRLAGPLGSMRLGPAESH